MLVEADHNTANRLDTELSGKVRLKEGALNAIDDTRIALMDLGFRTTGTTPNAILVIGKISAWEEHFGTALRQVSATNDMKPPLHWRMETKPTIPASLPYVESAHLDGVGGL